MMIRSLLTTALGLVLLTALHAAAPTAGTTQQQIAAGQPPTLTNFRINSGAVATSDRTLLLSWTLQGVATHWRVSTSPSFPNTTWNPLPLALPYKWLLPEGATDGDVTLHMQLLNDHGQSAVRSAQIRYDASPRVTAIGVQWAGDPRLPFQVSVTATVSGRVDRWRVTQSSTIDFKEWIAVAPATPLQTTHWVTNTPAGASATLWVHVQRDNVGQHSASRAFTLAVPRSDYEWSGNVALDAIDRSHHRVAASKLTGGDGTCTHAVSSGWAHSLGATSPAGPVRCRFTLFHGTPIGFAWALKSATVSFGNGTGQPLAPVYMRPGSECAIKELVKGGKAPRLAIEVYFPGGSNPIDGGGSTYCQLDRLVLTGPTGMPSDAETLRRQALPGSPARLPNDP